MGFRTQPGITAWTFWTYQLIPAFLHSTTEFVVRQVLSIWPLRQLARRMPASRVLGSPSPQSCGRTILKEYWNCSETLLLHCAASMSSLSSRRLLSPHNHLRQSLLSPFSRTSSGFLRESSPAQAWRSP